jgi:2-polyprenyl-6-methoxyphenol hydroxylase-like FAD-dependent oxidoreductase
MSPTATQSTDEDWQLSALNIAIIGDGIVDLTTALPPATNTPGLNITLYDQASANREIGAGIGISVKAARVLRRICVYDQASAISGER